MLVPCQMEEEMPRQRTFYFAIVLRLQVLALVLPSCGLLPLGDPGGGPCPCKEGLVCVNSICRADCRSSDCLGDTECHSIEGADLAVCMPPGEALAIQMDGPKLPVPIDLFWVVEQSAGTCQERNDLARSFFEFHDRLGGQSQVSVRTAVADSGSIGFLSSPATQFPPGCGEYRVRECADDEDCLAQLGGAGWHCNAPSTQMVTLNGSMNSICTFRCGGDSECCREFCFLDECAEDPSCLDKQCKDSPNQGCAFECEQPGGGPQNSGCLDPPASRDCPVEVPSVLDDQQLSLFPCLAVAETASAMSYAASLSQGLAALWTTLDPTGPNTAQAAQFLRPQADLAIMILSDEEDCSIDPDFASPNFTCKDDKDCPGWSSGQAHCKTDLHFSQMSGKPIKLCHGSIKKDYYHSCGLLGEYQGLDHHNCAYDLGCKDCQADADCLEWWYCKSGKCRPNIYGLPNIATFQNPPGTPIFALAQIAPFREKLLSLKKDPLQVFSAAIVGDGLPLPPAQNGSELPSLISKTCLDDAKLKACAAFTEAKKTAETRCIWEPSEEGCEEYRTFKLACIRECYVASKGDPTSPTMAGNSYAAYSDEVGRQDAGLRYIRFAEMFGAAGAVYNPAAGGGIRAALLGIADRLNRRIYRACLPEGYSAGVTVLPLRQAPLDAETTDRKADEAPPHDWTDQTPEPVYNTPGELLTHGPDGDYEILPSWYACCPQDNPDCPSPGPAIQFYAMVKAGTTFEVVYVTPQGSAN